MQTYNPQSQDATVYFDTSSNSGTAVNGVVWAKTGLSYIDLNGIGHLEFSFSGTWNVQQSYQASNDLTNWFSVPMQNDASVPLAENTSSSGAGTVGSFSIPTRAWRYFRIAITSYTSGTITHTVVGRAGSATPPTQPVCAIQDGTWTVQPGNTPNTSAWLVNTKVDLTPSAPAAATVGVTSAQAVAAAATRKGLVLTNTSANYISLGFGSTAVLYSGITLAPYGTFVMDEYTFDVGAVNAIASAASSNLAIQEYLT